MKKPVAENLEKGIVDKNGFMREAAPNCAIVAGGNSIKEFAKLWDDLDKVAVHRKNVTPAGNPIAIPQRPPYPIGRCPVNQLDPCIPPDKQRRHFSRII